MAGAVRVTMAYKTVVATMDGWAEKTWHVERFAGWQTITRELKVGMYERELHAQALRSILHQINAAGYAQLPGSEPKYQWHEITQMEADIDPHRLKRAGDFMLRTVVECIPKEALSSGNPQGPSPKAVR